MNALQRVLFALVGSEAPVYIKNPRVVSLFGEEVTRFRAWLCFTSFLINSHLALARDIPAIEMHSMFAFLGYVAGYFVFYLGLMGFGSVFVLWLFGWLFSMVVEALLPTSSDGPFYPTQAQREKVDDMCRNIVILAGEAYLTIGYFFGFAWSHTPTSLWGE